MSSRVARAVVALMFAGSAGTGLLAVRNTPQASEAAKTSAEAVAAEALNTGRRRLAQKQYEAALKDFETAAEAMPTSSQIVQYQAEAYLGLNRLDAAKQSYMHLFVHDRTASHVLMKTMKAWVDTRRANPAGVAPAVIDSFDAWVRERDTLAMSVGNLGHNSPDWK
jgi:tetratricopeptide (TPR) repeat protein